MSILEDIANQRRKFLDGLDANEGDINLDIFEDFYPDKAHFIYELLQNAEDAEATEATFTLTQEYCAFEHNGKRHFTEKDVRSITGIHNSTKSKSTDQIGKFGVGFKSVFVYTLTPIVYSDQFAFRILRLVLPDPLDNDPKLGDRTRFLLPFNNLKKSAQAAYEEIKAGLEELAETNLLFLSSLTSIRWQDDKQSAGKVLRIEHSDNHIEVQKQSRGKKTTSSHFLRFSDAVEGLDNQCVSIAFELDFLPNISTFDSKKPLDKQLKIIPANPGKVAVFFPADKETSGLRFHMHAPFVPELSRASIKETPVNEPLFNQIARLTASSLHKVRDMGLLTGDFLGVLPNPKDEIPKRYQPIFKAIVMEMNEKPLTPTHARKHEPAKYLLQAKASLKSLLSEEDVEFLVDYDEIPFKWAIGAQQKNSHVDYFLSNLAIQEWDVEAFVLMLEEKASETSRHLYNSKHEYITDAKFMEWLSNKSEEWHQELYALLELDFSSGTDIKKKKAIERLKFIKIIRLSNGSYSTGNMCYFPRDGIKHDELIPCVAIGVYSSGKSKDQQQRAKTFLENCGVRNIGEAEQVEIILKKRYQKESFYPDINDINRFISLVEKEPEQRKLFANYYMLKRKDGKWGKPGVVYLDEPLLTTGLSAFYDALGDGVNKKIALDESYIKLVSLEKIVKFAKAVGAQTQLEIVKVTCSDNPQWGYLASVGGNTTNTAINRDYNIIGFPEILLKSSLPISKLIWKTMYTMASSTDYLYAVYQKNQSWGSHRSDSQLVHHLKNAAWVPQTNNTFVTPSKASRELLPEGFSFDSGQAWHKAVHFGEEAMKRFEEQHEKQMIAKELGFHDTKSLEDAKWFAGLSEEERQQFKAEYQSRHAPELPECEPANGRSPRVSELARDAPERFTEKRLRTISIGREEVKKEAEEYLRQQYKKDDDPMTIFCQVCKKPMPFRLDNGYDHFEKVEFLSDLKRRHYQNYLALCPNHSAMFQFANGSRDNLKNTFIEIDSNEFEVVLARKKRTIYFTKTHIADLKALINVDQQENEQAGQS
ncbi:MAG: hypothetical protein IBX55_22080 [Methyloprofundus sp.]|nr:hypothetical protein [Methyloprofundus sp.]